MAWPGINNENEFYSDHYLSEIFNTDIQDHLNHWRDHEEQSKAEDPDHPWLAPYTRLARLSRDAQQLFSAQQREKSAERQLKLQRQWLARLLPVFGFDPQQLATPRRIPLDDDHELPAGLARCGSRGRRRRDGERGGGPRPRTGR